MRDSEEFGLGSGSDRYQRDTTILNDLHHLLVIGAGKDTICFTRALLFPMEAFVILVVRVIRCTMRPCAIRMVS